VAAAADGSLGAAIFFGSRSSGVATNTNSAYDLMLVCEAPRRFYQAMARAGLLHRSPVLLGLLDRLLPPTQIRLVREPWLVKASVLSLEALERATSPRRRDQFIAGRLFQDVHVVWAADPHVAARVTAAIESARKVTLDWAAPDLPPTFGASDYLRQLFRTSFRFEVRPENRGRADALSAAQASRLEPMFDDVLRSLAAEGRLRHAGEGRYTLVAPVSNGAARRRRLFMEWSRVRATARWPKHAVTFDGWLDYIIRKAERHSGETIVLTPLERRFPFVFLWPRALKFLARQRGKGRPV
jgi:hypothetical protein